ncbi:unnamed protein product [Schistosoma rodhaini]|uniref:Peptidase S54 rhomboid domain-containing protein n=1 Tax=Schistosoma rodhaini TaxID=6188 RepID=A0AA85FN97_9TREM|nr:unnamed protein product [Schistosoma rodhaini]
MSFPCKLENKTTVTKCFLAFSVIFSFILLMPFSKRKDIFTYNLDDIFENGSIWRLAFCQLPFLSTKDLVCGGLLLYYFRIFERRYGSRKFLSFLFYCAATTTFVELLMAFILRKLNFSLHILPSGPFNLIFPLFVPYFLDIPWVPVAHVMRIPITGKSFPYIFGFEVSIQIYLLITFLDCYDISRIFICLYMRFGKSCLIFYAST